MQEALVYQLIRLSAHASSHIFVYIGTNSSGRANKPGAKISISITARTDPNIKPYQTTNPAIIRPVTIMFHRSLNGNNKIFSIMVSSNSLIIRKRSL